MSDFADFSPLPLLRDAGTDCHQARPKVISKTFKMVWPVPASLPLKAPYRFRCKTCRLSNPAGAAVLDEKKDLLNGSSLYTIQSRTKGGQTIY